MMKTDLVGFYKKVLYIENSNKDVENFMEKFGSMLPFLITGLGGLIGGLTGDQTAAAAAFLAP